MKMGPYQHAFLQGFINILRSHIIQFSKIITGRTSNNFYSIIKFTTLKRTWDILDSISKIITLPENLKNLKKQIFRLYGTGNAKVNR